MGSKAILELFSENWKFVVAAWRNEKGDVFADGFLGGIAVHQFCAFVPARELAIKIASIDGILRRLDNCGKPDHRFFGSLSCGYVSHLNREHGCVRNRDLCDRKFGGKLVPVGA